MEYELTVVLPEKATPAKTKARVAEIEKLVKTFGGKIVKNDNWGKVDLAYLIKKESVGNFLHFVLELGQGKAKGLSEKLSLEEGVIRHLLVRKEK